MAVNTIDAKLLQKMFLSGAANLKAKKEWINDLNVFPVPDGDTGTNMTLTIMSAAKEINALADPDMASLAKAISSGSLRGARGNSGVILSQLFRGFTKEIKDVEAIDVNVLAAAFERAVETAYKAVMKPKEGTILTVAKGVAQKASELADVSDDLGAMMKEVLEHAEYVLSQTPEMLPVLKEAGVVDSGGQGLVEVLRGAIMAYEGNPVPFDDDMGGTQSASSKAAIGAGALDNVDIKFGYCTEFIIMLEKEFNQKTEMGFKAYLESIGDSIVCVADDEIVKVHVHTNDPGLAIQKALTFGQLTKMKIDNMREEHNQKVIEAAELNAANAAVSDETAKSASVAEEVTLEVEDNAQQAGPRKDVGFVTVVAGDGLAEIFGGLGVDYVIEGGQTMNPSTEDILNAVDKVNADTVFVLPNNKNIILAAQQAASIVEDKKIIVIPSKTVPQGITAMFNYEMVRSVEENEKAMNEGMANVKSGEVTYAVRDTSIDGHEIHCNDIMGLGDKGLLAVSHDVKSTLLQMLEAMVDDDSELISIYYGSDVRENEADTIVEEIAAIYPELDVELQRGGQPIYYYIVSVE
ncbi:MAG: DAK2 domain-containing protein [Clostridia bacterium]|nr:DAK2 domain-containing protein [Clostridia bacterium]